MIALPQLSFNLLLALARQAPNLLTAQELENKVWPGLIVSPATITKRVALLREAIGDDAEHPKYVSVVRGRGYRLIAPVCRVDSATGAAQSNGSTATLSKPTQLRILSFSLLALLLVFTIFIAYQFTTKANTDRVTGYAQSVDQTVSDPAKTHQDIPDLSIAVLPFISHNESSSDNFVAEGLAEEIINLLVAVESLEVVARTSSFTFRESGETVDVIARKLGSKHILEGSVQRYGERIRVTAQLIDAQSGYHLWAQKYDRPFTDIIAVQDDIALNIVTALKVKLKGLENLDSTGTLTTNAEAYALYLQGRKLFHDRFTLGKQGLDGAVAAFSAATRIDPDFARAWSGLGASLWLQPAYTGSQDKDRYRLRARQAALRALEINPDLPEALSVIAAVHWLYGEFEHAMVQFEHAIRQPVGDSNVRLWAGMFLNSVGYTNQAYALYEQAYQVDPLNQNLIGYLAASLLARGEPEKTLSLRRSQSDTMWKDYNLGIALLRNGDFDAARQLLADYQMPDGTLPSALVELAIAAVAHPEKRQVAENVILEAVRSGQMEQRIAFELFYIMESPAIFELNTNLPTGMLALRLSDIVWSTRGSALRQDKRFHTWAREIGLVDFWDSKGWPNRCQPVSNGEFECV